MARVKPEPHSEKSGPEDSAAWRPPSVSLAEAFWTWARVALLSFGGPAGQIAVMHRILVDEKKWLPEDRFLHALNYCMLLPGPEAQQLATYIGWLMHRAAGGVLAGTLFVLPGFVSILLLSLLYVTYQQAPAMQSLLFGLKAAVMAIVVEALIRVGRRVLKTRLLACVAALSFLAVYALGVPFPALVLLAAITGWLGHRTGWLPAPPSPAPPLPPASSDTGPSDTGVAPRPSWQRALGLSAIFLSLWWGPVWLVRRQFGADSVFYQEGVFFSKAAVVTFGGAYSVLAYVKQQAVEQFGWLLPGEMQDGLGMAETTPGPLIMVVQFVAFLGAYRNPGPLPPLAAAILGSLLTTWVTFVPCFYWIFLGAPYVERLRNHRGWAAALTMITAAVVGVILNLAVWFALHTLFGHVQELTCGPLRFEWPDPLSLRPQALLVAAVAFFLTFRVHAGMPLTLAACCGLGLLLRLQE